MTRHRPLVTNGYYNVTVYIYYFKGEPKTSDFFLRINISKKGNEKICVPKIYSYYLRAQDKTKRIKALIKGCHPREILPFMHNLFGKVSVSPNKHAPCEHLIIFSVYHILEFMPISI